ncbi:PAS domain S-box protein [Methanosarcina sp. KYL-1]|uniref:PAS domain S-box protein n=1 Tax=Methanosarcina sp. KYL-1 TaxID=2602068 RepID=UPI002100BFE9|nr:PAS domain S-box protein [Methanosarcina sp. KYL-1]MCQ1535982.1 PAS domain S-box protein [Methanosarcina sp. KYL-1]
MEKPGQVESCPLKIPDSLLKAKGKEKLPDSTGFPDNVSLQSGIRFQDSVSLPGSVSPPEFLLDYIPSPVFQRERNGIYVNCNEKFARQIMGLPKGELIGKSFTEFQKRLPDSLKESYRRHDQKLLREGGNQQYETEVLCADGVKRDFIFNKAAYKDGSGNVAGIVGVMVDITENRRNDEFLHKSEERYRVAMEQTGHVVYDCETRTGNVEWAGAIKELTGYSFEEFKKFGVHAWMEHIHPEDLPEIIKKKEKYWKKGREQEKFCEEYRMRRKDGSYFYVVDSGIFLRDEKGVISRVIGVKKDITEQKFSEKKLRESEERYRSFVQNFKGIAFHLDKDGTPIFAGGDIEEITGYRAEEFISGNLKWEQIIEPEDLPRFYEKSERLKTIPNHIEKWEYRIRRKNGKIRWAHEIIQNISDEAGIPVMIQGTIYDITDRKVAEEKLRLAEEIRKKEIHHRIKNNLQVISSLLELQSDKFEDESVLEAFRESQNRVISMAIIHEDLYRSPDLETLDFAPYIRKLTSELLHSYSVGNDEISLALDIEPAFLNADIAVPLGIIVNELVSNSLKYAFPEGRRKEIGIKLSCTKPHDCPEHNGSGGGKNRYTLIISDSGRGLPEGFDFRNSTSLGLQLVNTLVDQIDGSIELENSCGTKFTLKFREVRQR